MAKGLVGYVISLVLGVYFVAYLLPGAMVALTNATSWVGAPTVVITIGTQVLAILILIGMALAFMPDEIKGKVGL